DQGLVAAQAVDGRGVDDGTPVGQVRVGRLRGPEVAVDVDLERAVPLLCGQLGEVVDRALGGDVVDQDVQAAQLMQRLVDSALAVGFLGQVTADGHAPAPGLLDQAGGVPRVLVLL